MRKSKISGCGRWFTGLLLIPAMLPTQRSWAAEDAPSSDLLLNLFVEKGYVSAQEAQKVKEEAAKRQAELEQVKAEAAQYKEQLAQVKADMAELKANAETTATNISDYMGQPKLQAPKGINSVEFFGDARVRYEARTAEDPAGNRIQLDRYRYALRFGFRGDAVQDVYYGFRLETAANPRSPWVNFGSSSSSATAPYQGPYGKANGTLAVGQIYLGWHPTDWLDITVGKMPNLIYTTPMVWDTDLNPEGAVEGFKYTVGEADLFANFGQYLYADFNPNYADSGLGVNSLLGQNTDNIFMFVWQGGVNYHITHDVSAKIAATIYNYTGLQGSGSSTSANTALSPYFGDAYVGEGASYYAGGSGRGYAPGYAGYNPGATGGAQGNYLPGYGSMSYPFNQVGVNNLLVLELPMEINFKIKNLAARVFGDFAYNLDGGQRATDAANAYSYIMSQAPPTQGAMPHSFAAQTGDVKAYQIGFGLGSTNFATGPAQGVVYGTAVNRNAWEIRAYWQHIEQYALDPNLIDSDFFEGRENMQGLYTALAYAFTPNLIATFRYGYAERINSQLGTGGSNQDIPQMNPINHYNLIQVDLGVRF